MARASVRRSGVEEVARVFERARNASVGTLPDDEGQVEARPVVLRDRQPFERRACEGALHGRVDVEAEEHLEDRRVARRTVGVQLLDELLERQLLVRRARRASPPHPPEQLAKGRITAQIRTEWQRVAEVADERGRLLVVTARRPAFRRRDRPARVPVEQRLEGGKQDDEERNARRLRELPQRLDDLEGSSTSSVPPR